VVFVKNEEGARSSCIYFTLYLEYVKDFLQRQFWARVWPFFYELREKQITEG